MDEITLPMSQDINFLAVMFQTNVPDDLLLSVFCFDEKIPVNEVESLFSKHAVLFRGEGSSIKSVSSEATIWVIIDGLDVLSKEYDIKLRYLKGQVFQDSSLIVRTVVNRIPQLVFRLHQSAEILSIVTLAPVKETSKQVTATDDTASVVMEASPVENANVSSPELSFKLPKISDLPNISSYWSNVELPVDILLLTVEDCEFLSCFAFLKEPFKSYHRRTGFVYFGCMGDNQWKKSKIALVRCSKGLDVPGGSLSVAKDTILLLRPRATFFVGACSGLNRRKVKLGDVIVSSKLITAAYKITPTRDICNLIKHMADGWKAPLQNADGYNVKVHCGGVVLSIPGANKDIIGQHPEAIAIEMEGEGVFVGFHELKMDWLVVKGIKDFANERQSTSEKWEEFACVMAASLVANTLNDPAVFQDWPHLNAEQQTQYSRHMTSTRELETRCDSQDERTSSPLPRKQPKVKQGVPTINELEDLSQNIGTEWEILGRRLKFSDEELQEIDLDERFLSQKAYQMLKKWKNRNGANATHQTLYVALSHKFVSRKDLAEKYFLQGVPTSNELKDLSQNIGTEWEKLGRRLKFSDQELEEIDLDKRLLYQKAYQMLEKWKNRNGADASYQTLYAALSHKFVSRKDLAEKYFKQGAPTDDELEDLSQNIGTEWDQLGRRLKISNQELQEIDLDKRHLSQKALQMLKEWENRNRISATYQTLHDALSHRLVSHEDLAEKYCTDVEKRRENEDVPKAKRRKGAIPKQNPSTSEESEESINICVRKGNPKIGELELLADAINLEDWKKVARNLKIDDPVITAIHEENEECYEKIYTMLRIWKQKNGRAAAWEKLYQALVEAELGELAEKHCCEKSN